MLGTKPNTGKRIGPPNLKAKRQKWAGRAGELVPNRVRRLVEQNKWSATAPITALQRLLMEMKPLEIVSDDSLPRIVDRPQTSFFPQNSCASSVVIAIAHMSDFPGFLRTITH
jgi:hypothetical protein